MDPDLLAPVAAFARVAKHGSFTRAAADLGISTSALSQSVRALETKLGVRLLNRSTRNLSLTEAGQRLLEHVKPALATLTGALRELDDLRGTPSGSLRLTIPPLVGEIFLGTRLADFSRRHPQVQLDIVSTNRLVDLVAEGFDAGIRLGEFLAPSMVAVRITPPLRMAVVATPEYFARNPPPREPVDLHKHRCIRYRFDDGGIYRWEFERDGSPIEIDVAGPLISNQHAMILSAVGDSMGLAMLFENQIKNDLKQGRLIRVLEDWCPPFPGFYLYYSSRVHMPLKLRAFIDMLTANADRPLQSHMIE